MLFRIHSAAIKIVFDPASYTVSEVDGTAVLRIAKQGMIDRELELFFTTQDGNALSAGAICVGYNYYSVDVKYLF